MAKVGYKSDLEGTLAKFRKALGAKSVDFGTKAGLAIDMLDIALESLAGLGLLARLSVEVEAVTGAGRRKVWKYSLGTKGVADDSGYLEDVSVLKKSILEEDE